VIVVRLSVFAENRNGGWLRRGGVFVLGRFGGSLGSGIDEGAQRRIGI
jgi:hypothetical protein